MQVKETKNKGLIREYSIVLPSKDIQKKVEEQIEHYAKNVKMDGFRPGKVPLSIVKKKHGASIFGDVVQKAVSEATEKVVTDKKLRPALQPKIDIKTVDEGKDIEYSMEVEIYPDVPEIDFKKVKLNKELPEVNEKDIEDSIERLQKSQRDFAPIKKARAAKTGDVVVIDFEGKVDNVAFEGGKGEAHQLELGSGQFIPGFEDQLVGAKKDDKKDVKVTFPKDYGAKDLAGKKAVFSVEVKDILEGSTPKVDDEFAKKFGFDDIEKLKEGITKQIKSEYANITKIKLKKELFDHLEKTSKFSLPESMVKIEFDTLWNNDELSKESGKDGKETKEQKKKKEEYKKISERRVKLGILLAELGRKNDISVSEDELRKAAFEHARNYPGQEQQVLEYFRENPSMLEQLKGPILEDKVVDFIVEKASITEKKVPIKELLKFYESEAAQ